MDRRELKARGVLKKESVIVQVVYLVLLFIGPPRFAWRQFVLTYQCRQRLLYGGFRGGEEIGRGLAGSWRRAELVRELITGAGEVGRSGEGSLKRRAGSWAENTRRARWQNVRRDFSEIIFKRLGASRLFL